MYIGKRIRTNFQEFYYTVLHQFKRACLEPQTSDAGKTVTELQAPLLTCLKNQISAIQEDFFGTQREDLMRGIYLSAALGDELHLNHTWSGRDAWKQNMLEHQLFQTQNSGEQIATDLDDIMRKPQGYPSELVEIYFLLLALGFKGRLVANQISQYQKRLLGILFPTAPFLYDQRQTELIPGHARSVISSSCSQRFLDTRRWMLVWVVFMGIFTITTTYFWYAYHKDVGIVTRQLDAKTLKLGGPR